MNKHRVLNPADLFPDASAENQLLSSLGADLCRRCDLNLAHVEHNVQGYCDACWNQVLDELERRIDD